MHMTTAVVGSGLRKRGGMECMSCIQEARNPFALALALNLPPSFGLRDDERGIPQAISPQQAGVFIVLPLQL